MAGTCWLIFIGFYHIDFWAEYEGSGLSYPLVRSAPYYERGGSSLPILMDSHLQNASMKWAMIMEVEILLGDRVLTRQLGKNVVHGAKKITKPQHDLPTTRASKVVGAKQITQEGTERLATLLGSYVEKFTEQRDKALYAPPSEKSISADRSRIDTQK